MRSHREKIKKIFYKKKIFGGEKKRGFFLASGGSSRGPRERPENGAFAGECGGVHHGAPQGAENAAFSTV
jgi:hypothetical protein